MAQKDAATPYYIGHMEKGASLPVIVPTRSHSLIEYEARLCSRPAQLRGLLPGYLLAEVMTVAGYVSQLANRGLKYATIRRHVAAIAKLHQLAGQPSLTDIEALGVVLEGMARVHGKRQCQAPAFSVAELKQAIRALDFSTPTGLRDRAVLLLGFAGAFRRSELVP
jgi:site-specific recombinase XerD